MVLEGTAQCSCSVNSLHNCTCSTVSLVVGLEIIYLLKPGFGKNSCCWSWNYLSFDVFLDQSEWTKWWNQTGQRDSGRFMYFSEWGVCLFVEKPVKH